MNNISGDTLEIEGLASGLVVDSLWEIQLGSLSYRWTAGPYTVPLFGTLVVPVDIPEEAFLDVLAEDYLTDLLVRFEGRVGERVVTKFWTGPLYLAWPDGQQGAVRVWDKDTALIEAPKGIVDDALRATHDESDPSRVLPPLWRSGRSTYDAVEYRTPQE